MAILSIFKEFLEEYGNETERWVILEKLMDLRSEFLIHHAIRGFGMEVEDALELIRSKDIELSDKEEEKKNIIIAAIDNMIDFAVAEEFQMSEELPEELPDDVDEDSEEYYLFLEECESVCKKYNKIYADVENADVFYAMSIAAIWAAYDNQTVFTYMTQGDNRVRPWHRALEGISYKKSEFPDWMIPPIEYSCRCYLVEEPLRSVFGKSDLLNVDAKAVEKPKELNPVFSESVCKGGRIFSAAHPYFQIPKKRKKQLKQIAENIKSKWLK